MVAGLERSGSPVLLELLIRVLYRERGSHFLEAEVLLALQRTLTRQVLWNSLNLTPEHGLEFILSRLVIIKWTGIVNRFAVSASLLYLN